MPNTRVVRADSSGVVVIPREAAEEVLSLTREVDERETGWRQAFAGRSVGEALGVDDLIATLRPGTRHRAQR